VVDAGLDPVFGRRTYKRETILGRDDAAWKKARNKRTAFLAEVLKQRNASSSVKFGHAIDEWFSKADLEDSTRNSYGGYVERVIKPTLGHIAVNKLGTHDLESLYAELRRCRIRCDGKPFIEKHKKVGDHDCVEVKCEFHTCDPMAASTVRQIHSVISSALNAAVRWGWIESNPAKIAKRPRQQPPQPNPPSGDRWRAACRRGIQAELRLGHAGVARDDYRDAPCRGRRSALVQCEVRRRDHRDPKQLRRDQRQRKGQESTKTHQMRRVALDSETVALLRAHREWSQAELAKVGVDLDDDMFTS
jgi:hypothetical protein